ncbi:MAG: Dabb family protein [Bacteroidetes bacterium]|nr:Dabb family protein [Bacteroidota bacterium]
MAISKDFVHHVFFWLKNPDSKEDRDALVAGLQKLTKLDFLKEYHIGIPADTNRDVIDRSYSVSWLNVFENAEDEAKYQNHPMHLAFVKECSSLWSKVAVFDSVKA